MLYIISDIHGEYELLLDLLDKIGFGKGDMLISCGDMIEKGDRSIAVVKQLFSMPNALCLMGNHEYAFVKYYHSLMERSPDDFDGVLNKLRAYIQGDGELLDWETVDRLELLPFRYETDEIICVHAGVPLSTGGKILPVSQATNEQLVYDRTFKSALHSDFRCVFFGHTPTTEARIKPYLRFGKSGSEISDYYKVHLDTGAYMSGVLGCFRVDDCKTFYVSRNATIR